MNVVTIIQSRTGSSRFPGKVLSKIQGKPLLEHIIDFLKFSKLTNKIIVATTNLPEDNSIEKLAKKVGVNCYRGSSKDVLQRYYECAKLFEADIVVRITADNPLIDPNLVDQVIDVCVKTKCDYASNMIHQTYPLGYLVEAMTFSTLERLHETKKDQANREHVVYDIRKHPNQYNIKEVFASSKMTRPEWRLTVDYKEDLELIRHIFSRLYKPNSYISYEQVFELLNNNNNFLKINNNRT